MATFKIKLTKALSSIFPDGKVDLVNATATRVGGVVVSKQFKKMDRVARHELLWKELDKRFEKEELTKVSSIMLFTPEEMEMVRAN